MAKRRQNISEEPESQASNTEDDTEYATEFVEKTVSYAKKRRIDEIENSPPVDEKPAEQPETPKPEEPKDEMEEFLKEVGGNTATYEMIVYRVPRYERDGRVDSVSRERCGRIDATLEYESEIQRRWARSGKANHFVIVVKKNGRFYKQLPVFSCEPLMPEEASSSLNPWQYNSVAPAVVPAVYDESEIAFLKSQQPPPVSPLKQFKEFIEMQKLVRDTIGQSVPIQAPPAAPVDPEVALLQVLAKDGTLVDKLAKGALGKLLGDAPASDRDPWAEVAMEAIKSGQGAQIISSAISALFSGFGGLVQRTQQNEDPPPSPDQAPAPEPAAAAQLPDQPIEMQVLALALDHCARSIPAPIAAQRVMNIADELNEKAPAQSIDGYLSMFANMEPAAALELAKTLTPNGEAVTAMPHAEIWTAELQGLLKKALEVSADGDEQVD